MQTLTWNSTEVSGGQKYKDGACKKKSQKKSKSSSAYLAETLEKITCLEKKPDHPSNYCDSLTCCKLSNEELMNELIFFFRQKYKAAYLGPWYTELLSINWYIYLVKF